MPRPQLPKQSQLQGWSCWLPYTPATLARLTSASEPLHSLLRLTQNFARLPPCYPGLNACHLREVLLGCNTTSNPYPDSLSSQHTSPLGTVTPVFISSPVSFLWNPSSLRVSVGSSSWLHPQHLGQCLPLQLKKELPDCPLAYFALSLSPSFHTVLSAWAFGSCTSQTPWRTGFLNFIP